MKTFAARVSEAIVTVDPRKPGTVAEAVNKIMEETVAKTGDQVTMVNDDIHPGSGQKGRVKSIDGGIAQVELANGAEIAVPANQLVPV